MHSWQNVSRSLYSIESKLSAEEFPPRSVAITTTNVPRKENKRLKKQTNLLEEDANPFENQPRASSFDATTSTHKNPVVLVSRPGSFDASRASAFQPVEVPRLLVQSPGSPHPMEPLMAHPDSRLLTVPSPDFVRKSPVDKPTAESPKPEFKPNEYLTMGAIQGLNTGLLNQLSAITGMNLAVSMDDAHRMPPIYDSLIHNRDGSMDISEKLSFDLSCHTSNSDRTGHESNAEMMAQMPAKNIIQEDIRSANGRFQLVRKRGRSEVWNLFGQVFDTVTNLRLPFVACYACKVLYTDTGGGTGNMTRHRCPIGVSYRSSAHGSPRSSTETLEACASSFESSVSVMHRTNDHKPTLAAMKSESSGSAQLVSQTSGEVSIGEVEREVLTDAVVKCCALDLLDPNVFAGRGFKSLLEKTWLVAKRTNSLPHEMFPDTQNISSSLQANLRFCTDDLKNELSRTSQGVCLTLESLSYNSKEYKVVHCCRISHDWKWRSSVLGVFKSREKQSLVEMVNLVTHQYELDKNLLRVTCARNSEEFAPLKTFIDVREKLREVLLAVLTTCAVPVLPMLSALDSLIKTLADSEVRLPFEYRPSRDDVFNFHGLLSDYNEHAQSIEDIIKSKCPGLVPVLGRLPGHHLKEIELFLHPFQETVESLANEKPNFHKVLPEWFALMHECQVDVEDTPPLLRDLNMKASELLEREKANVLRVEHRIAAILNPRLNRKLTPVCTEEERQVACERIRVLCNIRKSAEPLSRGSSSDGEPHRKRRMFLVSLEEDGATDDELECYLRSQFPAHQTKDLVQFWSSVGSAQFPLLANLARRILSVPATAPRTALDSRLASVAPDQLHTFLMLRSMFDLERDD